jgi:hypothetical protein
MGTTHQELYAEQYSHPLVGKLVCVSDKPFHLRDGRARSPFALRRTRHPG